jgi:virginiamycin B lyase
MRKVILGMASAALCACSGQAIVFQTVETGGACATTPHIPQNTSSTAGELGLTAFDAGLGSLPLLVTGPDGNLWFTADQKDDPAAWTLDEITSTGIGTEVRKAGSFFRASTEKSFWWFVAIAAGPDGNMWATEIYDDPETIALVTRTAPGGSAAAFSVDGARQLGGIAQGPDGNLWFTEIGTDARIGRITPRGQLVHFPLGSAWSSQGGRAGSITAGPDGRLWFAAATSRIGRMTVDGEPTDFALPSATDTADVIVAGARYLWFLGSSEKRAGSSVNVVGRVTPEGCVTEFRFELMNGSAGHGLATDSNGDLWFTAGDEIVRFQVSGAVVEYPLPGAMRADAIALGPDAHIWFTDSPASGLTHVVRIDAAY